MIICSVFSDVELSYGPEVSELFLWFSAADTVEVHVHGLGIVWNDGFVGSPYCC